MISHNGTAGLLSSFLCSGHKNKSFWGLQDSHPTEHWLLVWEEWSSDSICKQTDTCMTWFERDDSVGLLCYASYTAASSSTEEQDDGWKGHIASFILDEKSFGNCKGIESFIIFCPVGLIAKY